MKKDIRDTMIESGYYMPIIFGILMLILFSGFKLTAQTPEQVFNECVKQGIKHPEIVTKQAILETGNFECINCSLDHNNLFGFRWKGKYLEFDSWQESVAYYKKWQQKWFKGEKQYFDFLECIYVHRDGRCQRYAESEDYIYKLKQIEL